MARDFRINGESLITVKGRQGSLLEDLQELGLTYTDVRIFPRFHHKDVLIDSYGPRMPADVISYGMEALIQMTLIHYDREVLNACLGESVGIDTVQLEVPDGRPSKGGTMLGGQKAFGSEDNHFISVTITSPVERHPWRFPTSYVTGEIMEIPLGTKATIIQIIWRAIPYQKVSSSGDEEILPQNGKVWDHTADT
jgi:hypothetical protein